MTLAMLRKLLVPVPPLLEQETIAAILDRQFQVVNRALAGAAARLRTVDLLLHAYLRNAFHGIVPLSSGRCSTVPPSGWTWRRLADLARLESGHTPSRRHPEWWGGDISWISLPDIRALDGRVAYETAESTNEAGIENSSARVLPAGTVVLSRTASVGFATIMGREMATSQDFVNWVCGPDLDPHFLALVFRASRAYIRSLASGAVHMTVYMPTLQSFEICAPLIAEQSRIVERVSQELATTDALYSTIRQELAAIEALPTALLRHAFNGGP
jgi:type I restriction enzyme S subunit